MLLNALIRRLNGGSDANSSKASSAQRPSSRAVYEKFPILPDLLIRLLRTGDISRQIETETIHDENPTSRTMHAQRVFPALEILSRSGLPINRQNEIVELIQLHMCSTVWAIREKAAHTLSLVISLEDIVANMAKLLQHDWHSQNALHGRLLCVRYLLDRLKNSSLVEINSDPRATMRLLAIFRNEEEDKFSLETFNSYREKLLIENPCPITVAAWLDILTDALDALRRCRSRFHEGGQQNRNC